MIIYVLIHPEIDEIMYDYYNEGITDIDHYEDNFDIAYIERLTFEVNSEDEKNNIFTALSRGNTLLQGYAAVDSDVFRFFS